MKNLAYIYKKGKNDINGNPKHWVTLYWIPARGFKRGEIVRVGKAECGYIGKNPTLCRLAAQNALISHKEADLGIRDLEKKKIAIFHEIEI